MFHLSLPFSSITIFVRIGREEGNQGRGAEELDHNISFQFQEKYLAREKQLVNVMIH